MWKHSLIILTCCLSFSAQSDDSIMPGKKLHDDANCMRCHAKLGYNTDKTIRMNIQSIKDLKRAVDFCNHNLNVGWFDDEVSEVVDYLNKTYYKLPN
ncbi:MAG: hypothetical protein IE914_04475 [Thiotrichales bacterium]|nr:hypothetical protein [Thiotrichales bacterium]